MIIALQVSYKCWCPYVPVPMSLCILTGNIFFLREHFTISLIINKAVWTCRWRLSGKRQSHNGVRTVSQPSYLSNWNLYFSKKNSWWTRAMLLIKAARDRFVPKLSMLINATFRKLNTIYLHYLLRFENSNSMDTLWEFRQKYVSILQTHLHPKCIYGMENIYLWNASHGYMEIEMWCQLVYGQLYVWIWMWCTICHQIKHRFQTTRQQLITCTFMAFLNMEFRHASHLQTSDRASQASLNNAIEWAGF